MKRETAKKKQAKVFKDYSELDRTQAFYIYYQEGESRTLNKVSKKTGIPIYVIKKWSVEDKWAEKVKENDELINDAKLAKEKAKLAKIASIRIYSLYTAVLQDPKASVRDKLTAADKLKALVEEAEQIKQAKKIYIRLSNVKDVAEKLKKAGIKVREDIA
jgi:3-methyladenine DNA glycosylase Mpg